MSTLHGNFADYEERYRAIDHIHAVRRRYLTRVTRNVTRRCLRAVAGKNGRGAGLAIIAVGVISAVLLIV